MVDSTIFTLVEASKLSRSDKFLRHYPETDRQRIHMELIQQAIDTGVDDFCRPIMDPSFSDKYKEKIQFVSGVRPAIGRDPIWWRAKAKELLPDKNSRLGKKNEYFAFCGVLIQKLIEKGWASSTAWYVVCDDSRVLGNCNDKSVKHFIFEKTGGKEVCGFYDLMNTYKLLDSDDESDGFYIASGSIYSFPEESPLASIRKLEDNARDFTGWIVIDP